MARAITRFIDVVVTKDTPSVTAAGFGVLAVVTDNDLVTTTTRIKRFTTADSVSDFFGPTSEEYYAANAFFNQAPENTEHPEEINFVRFANSNPFGTIEGGDEPGTDIALWQGVTSGGFGYSRGGTPGTVLALNFAAVESMDDVCSVIEAGSAGGFDVFYRGGRFILVSNSNGVIELLTAPPTGTDISGATTTTSNFLNASVLKSGVNPGGTILSDGASSTETFAAAITAIETVNNDWASMGVLKEFRDSSSIEDMADAIESRRKIFVAATNDVNVLTLGSTSTFSYYGKNANYKRTAAIYNEFEDEYSDMAWLGLQLPKKIGSTNWALQTLPGIAEGARSDITPSNIVTSQIDAALDVNTNVYTTTLGSDFIYFGTMLGGKNIEKEGEYIDIVRNIDFLQARVEEGLMSLLLEKDILPMTNAGISIVDNRLKSLLDTYGVKQGILIEGSIVTSFPKRSEISQSDRDDRLLPDGTFTAELTGGINKVVLRGKVYI